MGVRATQLVWHALQGFNMDEEEASKLLESNNEDLTRMQREQVIVLKAAIDNLVDFAVAEEFQFYDSLPDKYDGDDHDIVTLFDKNFKLYNSTYASIENGDVEYAMGVAAGWVKYSEDTVLVYMTQGDNRVRPWHMALEGTSYPKYAFPAWLIPPIEHGCRCFLVEDMPLFGKAKLANVMAKADEIPDFISPVFMESVAKGGRIFGPAHSYFNIPKKRKKRLKEIAERIKGKWLRK